MTDLQDGRTQPFYSLARLGPILFLALLFFLTFIARVCLSPLMPSIESELHLSHSQAGAVFLLLSIGYFLALLGSGFLSARVTHKYTIVLSATGTGIALVLISLSSGLWGLRAGVFLLGAAAGLYLPSGMTTLTDMVDARNWGKAVSIHEIAPNLAFVTAPLLTEILLLWFSWRMVPAATGACAILTGLLFLRFGRWGRFPGRPPDLAVMKHVLARREFWIMTLLFGLAISSTMGIYTMLPLYLTADIGMSRPLANTLIAASRGAGMATALISGWATDRYGARKTIVFALGCTGAATLLLAAAASPAPAGAMVCIQAMLATVYFPAGFTALSSHFSAELRNLAISFTIPLAFVFGGGLIPSLIGFTGDIGSFSLGFAATGGLILIGCIAPVFLKPPGSEKLPR
jgi:NNP family nitrate/nitrite transporter-like MFS transporter